MSSNRFVVWIASPSYMIRQFFLLLFRQKASRYVLCESGEESVPWDDIVHSETALLILDDGYVSDFEKASGSINVIPTAADLSICLLVKDRHTYPASSVFRHIISIYDSPEKIWAEIESAAQQELQQPTTSQNEELNEELSEREKEVLVEIVKGFTNKEIADRLYLSVHTVISHRKNITRKLDIKSTSGLTVYAIMNKLISIDDLNKR